MALVCVVEDEEAVRELILDELSEFGHDIVIAEDGQRGIDVILEHRPELIISDINMPHLNGFEMRARLLREAPEIAETPFMFLSAFADSADIADGMVVGADAYLTKPIDFDLLVQWVNRLT